MDTPLIWEGVDWFGCDDDLAWEPLRGVPARGGRGRTGRTSHARRSRRGEGPRRPAAPVPFPAGTALRRVLILDVENVCPGSRRARRALARLHAVLTAAGPVDQVIAASAASQHGRLDQLLRRVGVNVHTRVTNRRDAADRALIRAARRFALGGDCEIVLASNDHAFRTLAGLPGVRRVVLVTVPELATARSLLRIADELRPAVA